MINFKSFITFGLFIIIGLMLSTSFKNQSDLTVELVIDSKAELGEGAIWHPNEKKLYWIDIEGKALHIYNPLTKEDKRIDVGERIGTVVPKKSGGVLVALQTGIHDLDLNTGKMSLLVNPLPDYGMRFNDGKCDPSGRFWVGSMALDSRKKAASLYRLDSDNSIHKMLDSVSISNGIVWTSDRKTMYYNDTPTMTVQAFDYDDKTGSISNRRISIKIPKGIGSPDGMTIDSEDKLWIALWGGNAVGRFDPLTGNLLLKVYVPAPNVSSCAFGGPDLNTLYITTARAWVRADKINEFPLSGGLFKVETTAKGVPTSLFNK